jgi:tetratricopeptide (TPR) repeat protein
MNHQNYESVHDNPTKDLEIWIDSCAHKYKGGDFEGAISEAKKGLETIGNSVQLLVFIGASLLNLEKYIEARIWLREAVSIDPTNTSALSHLAAVLNRSNLYDDAEVVARSAIYTSSTDEFANAVLAEILEKQGRCAEAAVYAELAPSFYLNASRQSQSNALPYASIPASFLPKSGGTYLSLALNRNMGYIPFCSGVGADQWGGRMISPFLREFMSGGCFNHTHYPASATNAGVLIHAGVRKYWVHVRDPREVALSSFHSAIGEGHGTDSEIAFKRRKLMAENMAREAKLYGLNSIEKYRAWTIPSTFNNAQTWIRNWVELAEQTRIEVLFTRFDELVISPTSVMGRVLDFFEIECTIDMPDPHDKENRFRSGQTQEWRNMLSRDEKQIIADLTDERLLASFGWEM